MDQNKFIELKARFETYEYRKAIHQAEVARRQAELILETQGFTLEQIDTILT